MSHKPLADLNKSNSNPIEGSSATWMLFEGGSSARVEVSLYPAPSDNNRPIDAYVVTELEGGAFSRTARRAANALYDAVWEFRKDLNPCIAGFDLSGNDPVVGESGGLAFLVALAKRLLESDPGPVAATGVISSFPGGWSVTQVNGINSKLRAALEVLPDGGRILYPEENENEISETIREEIHKKHLHLTPVSTVADTLDSLFLKSGEKVRVVKQDNGSKRKKHFSPILIAVAILCLFAAATAIWHWHYINMKTTSPVTQKDITRKTLESSKDASGPTRPVDEIQPVSDPPSKPSEPIKKESPSNASVTIELGGKSGMSTTLAWQLEDKLKSHFGKNSGGNADKIHFKGKIVVRQILEEWVDDLEIYMTKMILAVQDFYFQRGTETIQFPFIEIEVEGEGMAEGLLSQAGDLLFSEILNGLDPEYRPKNLSQNILVPRNSEKPLMRNSVPGFE